MSAPPYPTKESPFTAPLQVGFSTGMTDSPSAPAYTPQENWNIQQNVSGQTKYLPNPAVAPMPVHTATVFNNPNMMNQPIFNVASGSHPYQPGHNIDSHTVESQTQFIPNGDRFGSSFSEKAIRHAFVRKVYIILLIQLIATLAIVCLFTFHDDVKRFVRYNVFLVYVALGIFIVTYMTLICCDSLRRKWPANFILLGIFTLAMAYTCGTIASAAETPIVLSTVGITAGICFLLTLFASQTKYLVYDTQMILGGRKYELQPEEHIFGAIVLYIDVINIFLAVLSLSKN